jgi:hypothetical protein
MHIFTELIQEGSDIFYKTMTKISKIIWNFMSANYEIIFRVFLLYFMSPCWKGGTFWTVYLTSYSSCTGSLRQRAISGTHKTHYTNIIFTSAVPHLEWRSTVHPYINHLFITFDHILIMIIIKKSLTIFFVSFQNFPFLYFWTQNIFYPKIRKHFTKTLKI